MLRERDLYGARLAPSPISPMSAFASGLVCIILCATFAHLYNLTAVIQHEERRLRMCDLSGG
jgi:hypothetical protein